MSTGTGRFLVVAVESQNGDICTGVTYGGRAMTQAIKKVSLNSSSFVFYIFYIFRPATGANDIVASYSSSTGAKVMHSTDYTGVKQHSQVDASASSEDASGTTHTSALTVVAANSWRFLSVRNWAGSSEPTASTGSTERGRTASDVGFKTFDSNGALSAGSTNMVTTSGASTYSDMVTISFSPYVSGLDRDQFAQGNVGNGTAVCNVSITPTGSDRVMIVSILTQNTSGMTSVTFDGVACTAIDSQSDGNSILYMYKLVAPNATTANVVVTRAGTLNNMAVFVYTFVGGQSTQPDASNKGTASGVTSQTRTLTTTEDDCWSLLVGYADNLGINASTGSTLVGDEWTDVAALYDSNGPLGTAGSESMTFTAANGTMSSIMIAIAPGPQTTAHTKTLDEAGTFTDTALKTPGKILSETVTDTDTLLKTPGKVLSETVTHTEERTTLRVVFVELSETGTNTDTPILKVVGKILSETGTFSDSVLKFLSRILAETATHTDSLIRSPGRTLSETAIHTEDIKMQITGRILNDAASFADTLLKMPNKVLTETATYTDTKLIHVTYNIDRTETAIFTENIAFASTLQRVLVESASFADITVTLAGVWIPRTKPSTSWTNRTRPVTVI